MKKILIGALIFGSTIANGAEIANDVLIKGQIGVAFVDFDDVASEDNSDDAFAYGAELEYLTGKAEECFRYGIGVGFAKSEWKEDLDLTTNEIYATIKYLAEEGSYVQAKVGWADGDDSEERVYSEFPGWKDEVKLELNGFMFGFSGGYEYAFGLYLILLALALIIGIWSLRRAAFSESDIIRPV